MTRINNLKRFPLADKGNNHIQDYPEGTQISTEDILLGSDSTDLYKTKNFKIGTIVNYITNNIEPSPIDDSNYVKKDEANSTDERFSLFSINTSNSYSTSYNIDSLQFANSNGSQSSNVSVNGINNILGNESAYLNHNFLQFSYNISGELSGLGLNKDGFRYSNHSTGISYDINLPKENSGTLLLSINNQKADESGNINLDIPEPDLSNYYTKLEADVLYDNKIGKDLPTSFVIADYVFAQGVDGNYFKSRDFLSLQGTKVNNPIRGTYKIGYGGGSDNTYIFENEYPESPLNLAKYTGNGKIVDVRVNGDNDIRLRSSSKSQGGDQQATLTVGASEVSMAAEQSGTINSLYLSPYDISISGDALYINNENGLVTAEKQTESLINSNPKSLITKEYFDANQTGGGGNFIPLSGSTDESPLTGGFYLSNDNSSDIVYSEKTSTVNLFNHRVSPTEYSKIFSTGGSGLFLEYLTPYNNNDFSRILLGGSSIQLTTGDNTLSFTPDYFLNNSFRINKNGRVIADGLSIAAIDDPSVGNDRVLITKEYLRRGTISIELTTDLTLNLGGMGREETIIYNTPTSPTRTVTLPSGAKNGQKIKIMNISEESSADIQVIFNGKSVSCLSDTNNKGSLDIIFLNGTWLYQYEQYRPIDLEIVEP